jgi:mannose/cellobiose epimerase-like protein (N-acyl-D-glucosamine 2-epimerase family)
VRIALFLLLLVTFPSRAQQSPFLLDPDRFVTYVQESADFWRTSHDPVHGGFFTNVARNGQVLNSRGTNKDMLTQSRNLYAMVRAFQLTGDPSYLDLASSAFRFMTDHAWDEESGGWFNALSTSGSPTDPNAFKQAFFQHYALLGPLALAEATDDSTAWRWVEKGLGYLDAVLWDATSGREGYFDRVSRTGSFRTGKSFNATVDALTTHALALAMARDDARYQVRLTALSDQVQDHLVASMPLQAIGFAEKFDTNWSVLPDERLTIMGHVLKTAWVLARLHSMHPDPARLDAAMMLADHVLERGYDREFGGPYKDYDRITGAMQLWGLQDSTKAWWQMEQAFTSGMELYRLTGEARYLDMADETLDFYMTHFVDPVHGEVFADRTRRGDPIPQWGDHKGDGYKAGYHSVEFGWYAYLYGQLTTMPRRLPGLAHVYYRVEARSEVRSMGLHPMESGAGSVEPYHIVSVTLDGSPYTAFRSTDRVLEIPAGVGGTFRVTFGTAQSVATEHPERPQSNLSAVWPNPVYGQAHVALELEQDAEVGWQVVDMLGRTVKASPVRAMSPGRQQWHFPTDDLTPGVYSLVVLQDGRREARSFVVLRP